MRYSPVREPIEFLLSDGASRSVSSRRFVLVGGPDWYRQVMSYRWTDGDTYSADASDPTLDAKVKALLEIGKPSNVGPRFVTL